MRKFTQNTLQNPYPFGSSKIGWKNEEFSYAYDFNGKETDSETGLQDYGFRIYNKAYGKFLSVDPLHRDYPYYSTYHFAGNTPIWAIDIDGLEPWMLSETNTMSKTGFADYINTAFTTYLKNGNNVNVVTDCAKFQFFLMASYFEESGQRLIFTGKNGKVYDSHEMNKKGEFVYKDFDHFFKKSKLGISTLHLVNSGLTRKKTSDEDLVTGDMKIKSEFIDGQYYGHAEGLVLDNDGNAFMFYSSGYDDGNCYTCFTSHYKLF
jgi:RHS repeat-associated protein